MDDLIYDSPQNGRTNKFNQVAGTESTYIKSVVNLYTNNKISERHKENNSIYNYMKKFLRINLSKRMKDLCTKNYKT